MSSISVKWSDRGSFRRFGVAVPANGDLYGALMAKILAVQPDFADALAWKDAEGDMIVFSSTTELAEAISAVAVDQPLRIFSVTENSTDKKANKQTPVMDNNGEEGVEHIGVVCDGCEGKVRGIRYKCMTCVDYDLCHNCEKDGKHAQHPMARIADPNDRTWMAHHAMFMRKMCKGMRGERHSKGPWGMHGGGHGGGHGDWWQWHRMRHQQQQQQNEQGGSDQQQQPQQNTPADFVNNGMDFLREVGQTVAEALTNLGINVDVDVEHNGKSEKVNMPAPTETPMETTQQQQPPTTTENAEAPAPPPTAEQPTTDIGMNNNAPPHDWTMVDGTESPTAPERTEVVLIQDSPTESLYPKIHHPDPRVNETLNALMAMGFDNQDGWLQQLVEAKRGDINAVLNALAPTRN